MHFAHLKRKESKAADFTSRRAHLSSRKTSRRRNAHGRRLGTPFSRLGRTEATGAAGRLSFGSVMGSAASTQKGKEMHRSVSFLILAVEKNATLCPSWSAETAADLPTCQRPKLRSREKSRVSASLRRDCEQGSLELAESLFFFSQKKKRGQKGTFSEIKMPES